MSGYKHILCPLTGASGDAAALGAALGLGLAFEAEVEVLHPRLDAVAAAPLVGEGLSGEVIEEVIAVAAREIEARAEAVRTLFETKRGGMKRAPASRFLDIQLSESDVAHHGRLSDLIVLPRLEGQEAQETAQLFHALLMGAGHPLLMIPPGGAKPVGRRVAVAWNGSAEAARAVTAARPFLERAEAVFVLTAGSHGAPEGLITHLARHGVKASSATVREGDAGAHLLDAAVENGADLLIMGAYTHSRLRQLLFGGVTRHVLDHAPIPVLMMH